MFNFFQPKPIVSNTTEQWIEACFAWAVAHFDGRAFTDHSRLVQPTNEFFPGRVDSPQAMATTVFGHVLGYAGLQHWPLQLVQPEGEVDYRQQLLGLDTTRRGAVDAALPALHSPHALPVFFHPAQCQQPGDLAGFLATTLAQHLILQAQHPVPGGDEFFAMAAEVVAVFMGFGVLLANSAYNFRGSCAKCYNPAANRPAALSEAEVIHALALFCTWKQVPFKDASRHLKPHLRRQLKQAMAYLEHRKRQTGSMGLRAAD